MATLSARVKELATAIGADIKAVKNSIPAPYTPPDSGVTPNTYGSSTSIPVSTVDSKGRLTKVINTAIRAASTTVSGIVQLSSATDSTSSTMAATPSAIKKAYDLANSAIPILQKGAVNGVASLGADGKINPSQMPQAGGGGIFLDDGREIKHRVISGTIVTENPSLNVYVFNTPIGIPYTDVLSVTFLIDDAASYYQSADSINSNVSFHVQVFTNLGLYISFSSKNAADRFNNRPFQAYITYFA